MNFIDIDRFLSNGRNILNDNIKLALYKENENIFDVIDFDNEEVFNEPLLFSYFNCIDSERSNLNSLICGFTDVLEEVKVTTDNCGRFYIPNVGWFSTTYFDVNLVFKIKNFELYKDELAVKFHFEKVQKIENTKIEILKYPISLLKQFYFNYENKLLDVEVEEISKTHFATITAAYNLIKMYCPEYFLLVEKYSPKCVVFRLDNLQRNSFAALSAHGIVFFNAFQDDYNEVFFIDDIAKQSGHVILNTLLADKDLFFKGDKNFILDVIEIEEVGFKEVVTINMKFHNIFSYYCSLICLDACLDNNVFCAEKKHEAFGRISFYLNKYAQDVIKIENLAQNFFSENGMIMYNEIKDKCSMIKEKWFSVLKDIDLSNQPYNFTYSKFLEINPI
ncbi:hypothetical protein [Flavobacterium collinsii]|jgi:hypothetical protein|uniref:Uncharacterized protein n=1 Tax=Flavobacterium collinsii TaxID=1114861 RepID=A0A9W4X6C6_9FLAO|nr:hypothetical protein [Flavobacterium collinsii]GIQ57799.1 hypothetical protein Flavo103_09350 [Flavobacterium collinsii]CAA9203006.1 hypothetical protein FLACOL7796_04562 [Flavobacterium collinsii]CAI2767025.1 conserved protein of unknown function [Flavobacterium collinsii]